MEMVCVAKNKICHKKVSPAVFEAEFEFIIPLTYFGIEIIFDPNLGGFMFKIYFVLFSVVSIFSLSTAHTNGFNEKKLGHVVAVERAFKISLTDISNNLKEQGNNGQSWKSQVKLVSDKSITMNILGDKSFEIIVKDSSEVLKEAQVIFSPLPTGYNVYINVGNAKVNKDIVMVAIEKGFKELELSSKPLVIQFLKVE